MASPSLMFVSQSLVLNGDASMAVRIAHEISHSWFGIILGPKDWTEEWISEVGRILEGSYRTSSQ